MSNIFSQRKKPLAERLAALVDSSGGPDACWPFLGYVAKDDKRGLPGYGQIRDDYPSRRVLKAHRAALMIATGRNPPDQDACHKCDNTRCCNPKHLVWGSHRYNMMDYVRKYGRIGVSKTERPLPPRPRLPLDDPDDDPILADMLQRLAAQ